VDVSVDYNACEAPCKATKKVYICRKPVGENYGDKPTNFSRIAADFRL